MHMLSKGFSGYQTAQNRRDCFDVYVLLFDVLSLFRKILESAACLVVWLIHIPVFVEEIEESMGFRLEGVQFTNLNKFDCHQL